VTWLKRITWAVVALALLATGVIAAVLGTSAGTRWLYAVVEPRLPAPLSVEGLSGSVLSGLSVRRARWSDGTVTVTASRVEVSIDLLPLLNRTVHLPRLRAGSLAVAIDRRDPPAEPAGPPVVRLPLALELADAVVTDVDLQVGEWVRAIDRLAVSARWEGTAVDLASLAVESDWLSLSAAGDARLEPPYAADLDGRWRWRTAGDREMEFAGELSIDGDWAAYAVQHTLSAPYAIQSDGEVYARDFDWSVDLVNEWQRLETVVGGRGVVSSEARLAVTGNLERYRLRLDSAIEANGLPAANSVIVASGDLAHLDVSEVTIDTEPAAFTASGRLAWDPAPDWAFDVDVHRIDPGAFTEAVDGELSAAGRIEGSLREDRTADVDVFVESLGGRLNEFPVEGQGQARIRRNRLESVLAEADLGGGRARVEGTMAPELELALTAEAAALDRLMPRLGGGLAISARVSGAPENPTVHAEIRSNGVRWDDFSAESLAVDVTGRLDRHSVSLIGAGAGFTVSAGLQAGLADGQWDAELMSMALEGGRIGSWSLEEPARLTASATAVSAEGYCISRSDVDGSLCVDADYSMATNAVTAAFDSRGVPLNALLSGVSDVVQARGTLVASGEAYFGAGRLDGRLVAAIEEGGLSAQYEGDLVTTGFERASLSATLEDGQLASEALLVLADGLGRVDARVNAADLRDPATPLDASLSMAIDDLTLFALFAPEVSQPAGRLEGMLLVAGTATEPEFRGALAVRDARFDVPAAGIAVEDLNVELRQSRLDEVEINGSARSGEGMLSIAGRTSFRTPTGVNTVLNVTGEDVELLRIPDREITASPDLKLAFDDRQVSLTGVVRIPSANFVVNELPQTAVSPSRDAVVHRDDEPSAEQRRYSIDVRAELGESVHIEGFGLSTDLEGSLQVQSASGSVVRGNGRLALVGGRYEAYGQDLTIETGELVFNGPLDRPDLNIRATRRVDNVVAGIQITGTPDQLRSTIFSEPAMSDAEALSYLLAGRPLSSASAGEGTSLNEAAFALGLSQAGAVTSQIQNTLGLDSLSLEGGVDSGRIVAGRRVGGRLFVEYGYGLVDQLGTLLLRFQLTDHIVVESSSGSAHTLNIVYSVTRE